MARALTTSLVALTVVLLATSGCSKKADEGGATASLSCDIADQHRCEEVSAPKKAQEDARSTECSSASGKLSRPARCPTAGFVGKCTVTEDGVTSVHRWYSGADAAYQKSFCADPAKGVWSTTF